MVNVFRKYEGIIVNINKKSGGRRNRVAKISSTGKVYVDYKDVDALRRLMSPNGKIYSAKRLGTTAYEQRLIGKAIKQARFMGMLPYTNATL